MGYKRLVNFDSESGLVWGYGVIGKAALMKNEVPHSEDITELAINIATSLYRLTPRLYPFQSARSHVFRLDFGDDLESKVLKIAKAGNEMDVVREQHILPALYMRGFEVPAVEFTQENTDFGVPFTTMPFVRGGWIGDAAGMTPAVAQAAYEHLGHFVARLSVLDAQTIPGARTGTEVSAQVKNGYVEAERLLRRHPRFTPRLKALLEQGCDLRQDTSGFVHWDGPQVITDGVSTFTMIDWGAAGAGHRLLDLGHFLMGHAFWVFLQQRRGLPIYPPWQASVLRGFLGGRLLTEKMRLQLHLLGTSGCILDAMAMAQHKHPKTNDFLTFIEAEDASFHEAALP